MRLLGLFFILCGLWLCFTILLAGAGLPAIAVGALLLIASRGRPEGTVTRVGSWILGSVIGISVVFAAIAFIELANGGKPTPHHSTTVVHDVCPPAGPLAEPCRANQHKATR